MSDTPTAKEEVQQGQPSRCLGLVLAACLAFSLGLAASSPFSTVGAVFRLVPAETAGAAAAHSSLHAERAGAAAAHSSRPELVPAERAGAAAAHSSRPGAAGGAPAAPAAPRAAAAAAALHAVGSTRPPARAGGPSGRCFALIDRHNHKTGGTTMRDIMLQNSRFGDCHYWGYGQDEPHWSRWLAEAGRALPTLGRAANATPVKLCLEAHFPVFHFMDARVPQIAHLRALAAPGCTVLLTTRVREPLSFYLSYFKWDIAGRQAKGETRQFGASFLEWAPPNLQANAMWDAYSTEYASRLYDNSNPLLRGLLRRLDDRTFRALTDALDSFDLVGTVEEFDAALLLTNDLLGGGLGRLQYRRTQPVHRHRPLSAPPIRSSEVCPDMAACAAHVRAIAPLDHKLYKRYATAFRARVAALGEPFAARVAAFKAAGEAPWVGGSDPEAADAPRCVWQADGVPESYEYADNPCITAPPQLAWLADRCMGVTQKNEQACCVRIKPPPAGAPPRRRTGAREESWHFVWQREVCRPRKGACAAPRPAERRNVPAWMRAARTGEGAEAAPPALHRSPAGRRRLASRGGVGRALDALGRADGLWARGSGAGGARSGAGAALDDDDRIELPDSN